ncbi:unnamed protein product [Prunus brigantina]
MSSVLYVKNSMTKTGLSEKRVIWLWLCHTAPQAKKNKTFKISSITNCNVHRCRLIFHRSAICIHNIICNIGHTFL